MEKYYRFAGLDFLIRLPEEKEYVDSWDLTPFEVDAVKSPHCFSFELAQRLEPPKGRCIAQSESFRIYEEGDWTVRYIGSVQHGWEDAYIRAAHRGTEHRVKLKASSFPEKISGHTVLTAMASEHLVAQNGGFIFHSSYIDLDGRGILFTAPSGTGKSTQAELWHSLRGAEILNGDRSAVRFADGAAIVEGVPFSGSSRICVNRTLPLTAVVYLSQAPETTIRRLKGYQAFARIWEGVSINTWDAEDMHLVSETVRRLCETVPVYHLACTPDESAVIALERMLRE